MDEDDSRPRCSRNKRALDEDGQRSSEESSEDSSSEESSEDEDETAPERNDEEQKCASKHFEDVGKRASIPYVPRYKLKGVDPRIATKSMIGHVGQLRKSHTDRDPMDTAGDPLHPRVYDTRPTLKIHVHVLSERYFSAVTSTGKDSPRASNR